MFFIGYKIVLLKICLVERNCEGILLSTAAAFDSQLVSFNPNGSEFLFSVREVEFKNTNCE